MTRCCTCLGIVLILLLGSIRASGQEDYARFKQITINDGLSLSSVYHIFQDSKGFMWFGTEDGLNRYDGQTISVYGITSDRHQLLANKWIEEIYEDKNGMIWLGSRGGLTMYDPRKGQFSIHKHDPLDPSTLSNDTITRIIADQRNDIWIGTYRGLNRVNQFTGEVERIIPDENELLGLMSVINDLAIDRAGNMWIATREGLFSYDRKSGLFFNEEAQGLLDLRETICCMGMESSSLWLGTPSALIRVDLSGQGNNERIPLEEGILLKGIMVDRNGQVWLRSSRGLLLYRSQEEGVRQVMESGGTTHSLAMNPVEALIEDRSGLIWYGTFGNGIFSIDPLSLESRHYLHNPADPSSLAENSINCLFEDRAGAIWAGTFGAGISILDPAANQFSLLKHNPFNDNSLASSFIWSIFLADDSTLWVGTNDQGISSLDLHTGKYTNYNFREGRPGSLSNPSVRKVYQDSRGRIWAGTDGGGLNLFEPRSGTFRQYVHDPDDPASISNNSVRSIYEDPLGRLWVGTRHGLNLMDTETGTFRRFLPDPDDPASISHDFIYSAIYLDEEGLLWVGTYGGGLNRLDPETGRCEAFTHDDEDPTTISDDIIFSIYEDPQKRLWIGTNSGLSMFYPATGSFRRFGIDEGLANEVIYGILPDGENRIWMSTNLGIIRFDLESFEVKNYNINDGLQSNEFNGGAFHGGFDGRMYFGGVYGLNIIDPEQVEPVRNVSGVTLTKLEVLGKEVHVAGAELEDLFEEDPNGIVEAENEFYCKENFTYMEELVLDYRHRFLSIEFAALNHTSAGNLEYSYIMENLENEWVNAGNRNYVSYANLKPGNYVFRVLARNADGFESNEPVSLSITITPPFWLSWWFIMLEVLFVAAIAIMIYNYLVKTRTNRILTYQNQQIIEANEALRKSERNLMELNATKDKFFSIISHDLKNPFSSLLSISELMVENFDDTDRDDHRAGFRKINQSLNHLLDLLENLLTWSRSQRGKIKFDPVRFNLSNLIQENVNIHRLPAERKGIKLCAPEIEEVYAHGDRDMINAVIRNLMTNAVKFTDRDKKVEVRLDCRGEEVEVSIVDEGVGINQEDLRRLFRIDQKFKSNGTAGERGTGLGLIICREFVEKHGGEISVDSEPGKGSTFSFSIPLSN